MSYLCFKEGSFLFLQGRELLILDQHARRRAKRYNCGEQHSVCLFCAMRRGMISPDLAERLQDPHFALPPLTLEQARRWKP
jgi:hypothetical protein